MNTPSLLSLRQHIQKGIDLLARCDTLDFDSAIKSGRAENWLAYVLYNVADGTSEYSPVSGGEIYVPVFCSIPDFDLMGKYASIPYKLDKVFGHNNSANWKPVTKEIKLEQGHLSTLLERGRLECLVFADDTTVCQHFVPIKGGKFVIVRSSLVPLVNGGAWMNSTASWINLFLEDWDKSCWSNLFEEDGNFVDDAEDWCIEKLLAILADLDPFPPYFNIQQLHVKATVHGKTFNRSRLNALALLKSALQLSEKEWIKAMAARANGDLQTYEEHIPTTYPEAFDNESDLLVKHLMINAHDKVTSLAHSNGWTLWARDNVSKDGPAQNQVVGSSPVVLQVTEPGLIRIAIKYRCETSSVFFSSLWIANKDNRLLVGASVEMKAMTIDSFPSSAKPIKEINRAGAGIELKIFTSPAPLSGVTKDNLDLVTQSALKILEKKASQQVMLELLVKAFEKVQTATLFPSAATEDENWHGVYGDWMKHRRSGHSMYSSKFTALKNAVSEIILPIAKRCGLNELNSLTKADDLWWVKVAKSFLHESISAELLYWLLTGNVVDQEILDSPHTQLTKLGCPSDPKPNNDRLAKLLHAIQVLKSKTDLQANAIIGKYSLHPMDQRSVTFQMEIKWDASKAATPSDAFFNLWQPAPGEIFSGGSNNILKSACHLLREASAVVLMGAEARMGSSDQSEWRASNPPEKLLIYFELQTGNLE